MTNKSTNIKVGPDFSTFFRPGLQTLKPLVSLSSLPPSVTLRIAFRAGVVYNRQ